MAENRKPVPSRGILSPSKRKLSPGSPDFFGNIVVTRELLNYLNSRMSAGMETKVELAGWKKSGQYGSFISLNATEPYDKDQEQLKKKLSKPVQQPSFDDDDDDNSIPF